MSRTSASENFNRHHHSLYLCHFKVLKVNWPSLHGVHISLNYLPEVRSSQVRNSWNAQAIGSNVGLAIADSHQKRGEFYILPDGIFLLIFLGLSGHYNTISKTKYHVMKPSKRTHRKPNPKRQPRHSATSFEPPTY